MLLLRIPALSCNVALEFYTLNCEGQALEKSDLGAPASESLKQFSMGGSRFVRKLLQLRRFRQPPVAR